MLLGTLILNMVACILFVLAGGSDAGKDLGTSIVYVAALAVRINVKAHRHSDISRLLELYHFCCGTGENS